MGKNINDWKLPLYKIYTDDEDVSLVTKIIKRGNHWSMGPEIEELENAIKNYLNTEYCVTFNSGTSALHAILLANKINENNEIIVPSFSFIATVNSVLFVNANPVFVDIEETNFGLDPKKISEKITAKTKAVIPMDYGGLSCKINEIKEVTEKNDLILIDDAAEALGATVNGEKVGTISDSSIFSFCGNKVLTTGEGGAAITNSKSIYEKLKLIRSHGRVDVKNYFNNPDESKYVGIGYNWRMSSITAALGLTQLAKLDLLIKKRREHAQYLNNKLSKCSQIIVPTDPPGYKHIYQMYNIRLPDKTTRDNLQKHLLEKKIFCKVYFNPIHLTSFYKERFGTKEGLLPVTESIAQQILTLPLYPNMTNEEKNYLINTILEFFENS